MSFCPQRQISSNLKFNSPQIYSALNARGERGALVLHCVLKTACSEPGFLCVNLRDAAVNRSCRCLPFWGGEESNCSSLKNNEAQNIKLLSLEKPLSGVLLFGFFFQVTSSSWSVGVFGVRKETSCCTC